MYLLCLHYARYLQGPIMPHHNLPSLPKCGWTPVSLGTRQIYQARRAVDLGPCAALARPPQNQVLVERRGAHAPSTRAPIAPPLYLPLQWAGNFSIIHIIFPDFQDCSKPS